MEYSDDYVMKFDCFYCYIEPELTHWNKSITGPFDGQYYIEYDRKLTEEQLQNLKMEQMPGFKISWNYDLEVDPFPMFCNDSITKSFVR